MYNNNINYQEFVFTLKEIYINERREIYYYPLIHALLKAVCLEKYKAISVYENKGYKDNPIRAQKHKRNNYADSKSLQDFIIVSNGYKYEMTESPYVSIEVKKPNLYIEDGKIKYKSLEITEKFRNQLYCQFRFCNYIIFTDCVKWYFLYKNDNKKVYKEVFSSITLANNEEISLDLEYQWDVLLKNLDEIFILGENNHK